MDFSSFHSQEPRELFEELQAEMEGCSTQIGRKAEQPGLLEGVSPAEIHHVSEEDRGTERRPQAATGCFPGR